MPISPWPKPFRYFKDVRIFLLILSTVVAVSIAMLFFLRYSTVKELLVRSKKEEARSYARLIVLVRHWNAQYGGVYVEKRPGIESNPYLRMLGIEPDIRTTDGRTLTLRNPAIMTRELSELAGQKDLVTFHMISLRALNPENRPDEFERNALLRFEQGAREFWQLDGRPNRPVARYAQVLIVEKSCLRCHAVQGYKVGDVRGGISITIAARDLLAQIRSSRNHMLLDSFMTIGVLLAIIYFLTWKLVLRLDEVQKRLKRIAVTDELTGLRNRRYIMEQMGKEYDRAARSGGTLSVIILDIDHFKKVNDGFGHAFGDRVLKEVSHAMKGMLRSYDLLGRIGGEEFLIASPGSTLDDAAGLAERIREKIGSMTITDGTAAVSVTISAGATSLSEQDARADRLLTRADEALYTAKQQGRNRVVSL